MPAFEAGIKGGKESLRSRVRARAIPRAPFASASAIAVACAVLASAGAARAGDVAVSEEARLHFQAGVALLQDPKAPRYEEAYREFKTAYAASPSFKILSNLGLCAMKIERDKEAINAYETYLKEAGPEMTADERAQIQRDLLTLKTGLVLVTVSTDPPGATIVDVRTPVQGPEVRNSYGEFLAPRELGLRHGHHTIVARLAGYLDQSWEFDASGSAMSPHVFHMERPQSNAPLLVRTRPVPTGAWIVGGFTVAFGLGGGAFALAAKLAHNNFDAENGVNSSAAQRDKNTGQAFNIVADSMFGAAILGAVVTTALVATRPTVERPASSLSGLLPKSVAPQWIPQGGGASATWVF